MRKRIIYFDMEKIAWHNETLAPSELEVESYLAHDPDPDRILRLDLKEALQKLTPRQQEVVELLAQGHTEAEIGTTLGISQQAVHKLLNKVRVSLKKSLEGGC